MDDRIKMALKDLEAFKEMKMRRKLHISTF